MTAQREPLCTFKTTPMNDIDKTAPHKKTCYRNISDLGFSKTNCVLMKTTVIVKTYMSSILPETQRTLM